MPEKIGDPLAPIPLNQYEVVKMFNTSGYGDDFSWNNIDIEKDMLDKITEDLNQLSQNYYKLYNTLIGWYKLSTGRKIDVHDRYWIIEPMYLAGGGLEPAPLFPDAVLVGYCIKYVPNFSSYKSVEDMEYVYTHRRFLKELK